VADDVAEALVAALKADGPIAAAVGTRVYPQGAVPRTATLPRITYQQVSADPVGDHLGGESDTFISWFQVDCWGEFPVSLRALRRDIRRVMKAAEQTRALAAFPVQWIRTAGDRDLVEDMGDGGVLFRVGLDVRICHHECEEESP
jgi:hypothetical protein